MHEEQPDAADVRWRAGTGAPVTALVGALLAFAVGVLGRVSGLDRDRAFYPTAMIVIASLYCLFAVIGASSRALVLESLVAAVFIAAALLGFRSTLWIVVIALAAHGVFDLFHGRLLANPGVPVWWPAFCFTYDVAAAGFLAWLLGSGRIRAAT
jgi:hypothetical protein